MDAKPLVRRQPGSALHQGTRATRLLLAWGWPSVSPTEVSAGWGHPPSSSVAQVLPRTVKELDSERLTFVINKLRF